MYRLFYNHEVTGDVLFLLLKPELIPNKVIEKENAALLYLNDELIGVNFFHVSRIIRLYSHGMIATPGEELLTIVNSLLKEVGLPALPPTLDSGYHVFRLMKREEHPLSDQLSILTLKDKEREYSTVTSLKELKEGAYVVAATANCILRDGSLFTPHEDHHIPVDLYLCSPYALRLGERKDIPFYPEGYEEGEDFYLPKEEK